MIDRHHCLGYRRPLGPHLRYALIDRHGRCLGALLFSYAARSVACRERFIGWDEAARRKRLDRVIANPRFLIFPWVRVQHLASKALSLAVRRLADDWQAHHGYRPVLVETFLDADGQHDPADILDDFSMVDSRRSVSVLTLRAVYNTMRDDEFAAGLWLWDRIQCGGGGRGLNAWARRRTAISTSAE